MASFPAGLIWISSYPKSGNTWMRVLLANLMASKDVPSDINNLREEDWLLGNWRFGDEMLIDPDLLSWAELETLRSLYCEFVATGLTAPFFCKTHYSLMGHTGQPALGKVARGALYLIRDPRDVAISLSHHLDLSVDQSIALMLNKLCQSSTSLQLHYLIGDWGGHVIEWADNSLFKTMVVRYEDLCQDTCSVLKNIVSFFDGVANIPEILRAVKHSSLGEMQRQESRSGFRERMGQHTPFFRSGRVGEWQEVLTSSQINHIENHFAPVMERFGYQRASQSSNHFESIK